MPRIMLTYPDGKFTYCQFTDGKNPTFELGRRFYTPEDIKATGTMIAVNAPELLRRFTELGIPCRPTSQQHTISISVQEETHTRLKEASKKVHKSVSAIMEDLALEWLEKNHL